MQREKKDAAAVACSPLSLSALSPPRDLFRHQSISPCRSHRFAAATRGHLCLPRLPRRGRCPHLNPILLGFPGLWNKAGRRQLRWRRRQIYRHASLRASGKGHLPTGRRRPSLPDPWQRSSFRGGRPSRDRRHGVLDTIQISIHFLTCFLASVVMVGMHIRSTAAS